MFNLSSLAKSAALSLGLVLGVSGVSSTGTPVLGVQKAAAQNFSDTMMVRDGERWQRGDRNWNRGGERWNRGDGWRRGDDRRWDRGDWRRHGGWRHHNRHRDWGWRDRSSAGIYLNFGVPAYRYVEPRYQRPAYRVSNAHVNWCYNRYRSYRAWDNSFQPYNGPRQQCWSPYS